MLVWTEFDGNLSYLIKITDAMLYRLSKLNITQWIEEIKKSRKICRLDLKTEIWQWVKNESSFTCAQQAIEVKFVLLQN